MAVPCLYAGWAAGSFLRLPRLKRMHQERWLDTHTDGMAAWRAVVLHILQLQDSLFIVRTVCFRMYLWDQGNRSDMQQATSASDKCHHVGRGCMIYSQF